MIALAPEAPTNPAPTEKEIIDGLLRTISASRLSTFLSCRLKFYFQYVAGIVRPKSPSLHVGSTVHEVLKQWNWARWRSKPLDEDGIRAAFEDAWANPEEPAKWESEVKELEKKGVAWNLLLTYFAHSPLKAGIKPGGVEVFAQADLSSHGLPMLTGVLDLVQERTIVDFKTASQTPNPQTAAHHHEVQSTAYSLLYREAVGEAEAGVEFHHLIKLKTPKLVVTEMLPMTEDRETRLLHLIESYTEGVSRRDFVPSPGLTCVNCSFLGECRKWS